MLNEVGLRLGFDPPHSAEESLTMEQVQLHYHWAQRAEMRRMKLHEHAVLRGSYQAFTGKSLS